MSAQPDNSDLDLNLNLDGDGDENSFTFDDSNTISDQTESDDANWDAIFAHFGDPNTVPPPPVASDLSPDIRSLRSLTPPSSDPNQKFDFDALMDKLGIPLDKREDIHSSDDEDQEDSSENENEKENENETDTNELPDLTPIQDNADAALPKIRIEHRTSIDELPTMSGGVGIQESLLIGSGQVGADEDDNIICDFQFVCGKMPYKVIRYGELAELGLPFDNIALMHGRLPDDFVTTYLGVQRALEAWRQEIARLEAEGTEHSNDVVLVTAMVLRGGAAPRKFQQVVYPEEIIPAEHLEAGSNGYWEWNGKEEVEDKEYWQELKIQGEPM